MGMGTKSILAISLITVLLIGTISFDATFADKEEKTPKTLESECAKKLDKKKLNLDGLFCMAIFSIQTAIADLQSQIDVLSEPDWESIQNKPSGFADNVDDDTQYVAGTGLLLAENTFSVDASTLPPPVLPVNIKYVTLRDDTNGHAHGWNPPHFGSFIITDPELTVDSIVNVSIMSSSGNVAGFCDVGPVIRTLAEGISFSLTRCNTIASGSILNYIIFSPNP